MTSLAKIIRLKRQLRDAEAELRVARRQKTALSPHEYGDYNDDPEYTGPSRSPVRKPSRRGQRAVFEQPNPGAGWTTERSPDTFVNDDGEECCGYCDEPVDDCECGEREERSRSRGW